MINLTSFSASPSQVDAGVVDLQPEDRQELLGLLNFDGIPTIDVINEKAEAIADIAEKYNDSQAMIGGAPYLLSALEGALEERGIEPNYSFTERVSVDKQNPDGTVTKQSVFEHKSFVAPGNISIADSDNKVTVRPGNEDKIVNLTQHNASPAQVTAGVVEPSDKASIQNLLTFTGGATEETIKEKAEAIADKAVEAGCSKAMIGGAPYLMAALETALTARGIEPQYAFSERNVVTKENPDGTVSKTTVFEHKGFITVEPFAPVDKDKDDIDKDKDKLDASDDDSATSDEKDDTADDEVDNYDDTEFVTDEDDGENDVDDFDDDDFDDDFDDDDFDDDDFDDDDFDNDDFDEDFDADDEDDYDPVD